MAIPRFGIQEFMPHTSLIQNVLLNEYHLQHDGYVLLDNALGHGVDVNEKVLRKKMLPNILIRASY